jgi:hypothetical protein
MDSKSIKAGMGKLADPGLMALMYCSNRSGRD